jgi:hypothetical protein
MKTIYLNEQHAYPIKLEQRASGDFVLTYGNQVQRGLSYRQAARDLGGCIMHAATCDGLIDIEECEQ